MSLHMCVKAKRKCSLLSLVRTLCQLTPFSCSVYQNKKKTCDFNMKLSVHFNEVFHFNLGWYLTVFGHRSYQAWGELLWKVMHSNSIA